MASLNLSTNGPSIKGSYNGVVNASLSSSSSPTFAHWALFTVQAPLVSAFQNSGSKESVLKVESTGEGELADLIEEFNDGRIQFAYVKVKDPNTALPKNVLIAWCGGGVPERTKGYFTSHLAAVSRVLHGYHVEITARSESDLSPESIVQKVADSSGSKYTAGGSAPLPSAGPPPVAKKPVFTPTMLSPGSAFNPLVAARNRRDRNVDEDGWGADAPQVTRTHLEKVESAYKPTKVNMAELTKGRDESTRFNGAVRQDDRPTDVVKGAYQPVGRVDIAEIRAAAQRKEDERPAPVKGAYEPVGKVDIAAIRAKAQRPTEPVGDTTEPPKSLADRSAAFTQSERLTELPKPKVAKKFGGTPFTGTKPPTPLGLSSPAVPAAAPVGAASRTFADQGGKTPAQLWAEKKARERGITTTSTTSPPATSPVTAQKSGSEWRSGYSGKSWAPVHTPNYGRGGVETQKTGGTEHSEPRSEPEAPASPAGGVSAIRDRFKDAQPMGSAAPSTRQIPAPVEDEPAPPPLPTASRPTAGFALPGLPARPPPADEEEGEEEEEEAPPIPTRGYERERAPSPILVALPVSRSQAIEIEPPGERDPPPPIPSRQIEEKLPRDEELPEEEETHGPRAAAVAVAAESLGHATGGAGYIGEDEEDVEKVERALITWSYEKAEDNEIDLVEGEYVTDIEKLTPDWWRGTNSRNERGLFPSPYVQLPEAGEDDAPQAGGMTAIAEFDYEAEESNELSFTEGDEITNVEDMGEGWWYGHCKGAQGLFPANYVKAVE